MNLVLPVDVKMTSIVLADDHKIIRDGIRALLSGENMLVIGEATNGRELLELLTNSTPDLVIMDLNMPEMDGFEALTKIREANPEQKVLVLSMMDHEQYVAKAMQSGANGYALKNIGKDELLCAINLIEAGHKFICTEISLNLLNKYNNTQPAHTTNGLEKQERKASDLSQREIEVLKLIAEGLTNAEIADRLFTSKRTIESHRQNIIEKTQVKNTASLIKYAITNGLID